MSDYLFGLGSPRFVHGTCTDWLTKSPGNPPLYAMTVQLDTGEWVAYRPSRDGYFDDGLELCKTEHEAITAMRSLMDGWGEVSKSPHVSWGEGHLTMEQRIARERER